MPYWEFLSFIFLLLENWISFFFKVDYQIYSNKQSETQRWINQ